MIQIDLRSIDNLLSIANEEIHSWGDNKIEAETLEIGFGTFLV